MRASSILLPFFLLAGCGGKLGEGQADADASPPPDDAAPLPPPPVDAAVFEADPPPPKPKPAETIVDDIQPTSFTLDGTSVYWTNFAPHRLYKAAKNGGPPVLLALAASGTEVWGVAVSGGDLFWTQTTTVANQGVVFRANLDGTGAVPIASGQRNPTRIVADAAHLFWLNPWSGGLGNVTRADHDGSNLKVIATVPTRAYSITVGVGWVCWSGDGAWCSDVDGTKVTTISTKPVQEVALDETFAYYIEAPDGVLRRVPLAGGPVEVIATATPQFSSAVSVDGTHVYFSAANWPGMERAPKTPNAAPELLTAELPLHYVYEWTSKYILDGVYYYYFGVTGGSNTSIKRRPK